MKSRFSLLAAFLLPYSHTYLVGTTTGITIQTRVGENPSCYQLASSGIPLSRSAWVPTAYSKPSRPEWFSQAQLPSDQKSITLQLVNTCHTKPTTVSTLKIQVESDPTLDSARLLAHHVMNKKPAEKLNWNWEPGILLYGLSHLDTPESRRYVETYHQSWAKLGIPRIDRADRCAPGLSSPVPVSQIEHYLKTEPRNQHGAIDHLGRSWLSRFYPSSVWVDSLMMTAVFASRSDSPDLREFAQTQPLIYSDLLRDSKTHFFFHAWHNRGEHTLPKKPIFWLRGNAWALVSMIEIAEQAKAPSARLLREIESLAEALRSVQQPDGFWDTLVNEPGQGYRESSGTALLAYAFKKGARLGFLDSSFTEPAIRAYNAVLGILRRERDGYSMTRISGPTNPGGRVNYQITPQRDDLGYGVGGFLLAANEMSRR